VAEDRILAESWADRAVLDGWRGEQVQQVEEVVAKVQREPGPDPFEEDWLTLASGTSGGDAQVGQKRMSVTYLEAIREAQARALREDPRVFIYGQDVGEFGGAFKATKNLAREFPGRVIDAPISEDAIVGLAVGAAIEGMRPVVEIQFADFSSVGFNQIVNQAATQFWRTQVPCPITIRLPSGERRERTVPQPESGVGLFALSGVGGDDAGDGGGRVWHAAGGDRDRRSGDLLRAQAALLSFEGGAIADGSVAHRSGADRAGGAGSDDRGV
jgi:hypothetical protein